MDTDTTDTSTTVAHLMVEAGICGFMCTVKARRSGKQTVTVAIEGSECRQVKRLARSLTEMRLRDLFSPLTRNPVYIAAEKAGCHPSCAIPAAVLKAVEVAMGMALPKDVRIKFQTEKEGKVDNEPSQCHS